MKMTMIRLLPMGKIGRLAAIWLAAALAALVLGGCASQSAPQMEWVNLAKDQQEAELDLAECRLLMLTQVPTSGEWTFGDWLHAYNKGLAEGSAAGGPILAYGNTSVAAAAEVAAEARRMREAIFSVCMRRKGYIPQEVAKPGEEEQSEGE